MKVQGLGRGLDEGETRFKSFRGHRSFCSPQVVLFSTLSYSALNNTLFIMAVKLSGRRASVPYLLAKVLSPLALSFQTDTVM
jgi:hypothetical protein